MQKLKVTHHSAPDQTARQLWMQVLPLKQEGGGKRRRAQGRAQSVEARADETAEQGEPRLLTPRDLRRMKQAYALNGTPFQQELFNAYAQLRQVIYLTSPTLRQAHLREAELQTELLRELYGQGPQA